MTPVALGAALVGGVCLVARRFVDVSALTGVGLALVGLAVLLVGARLAAVPWLRVVTALGTLALGWALLALAHDVAPDRDVDAALGGLATLAVALAVLRPARAPEPRGNHRS